jgi:hypothetical protein
MSTENQERSAEQSAIDAQNARVLQNGIIATLLPQSAILAVQGTTANEVRIAIEALPAATGVKLKYVGNFIEGTTVDGKPLTAIQVVELALRQNPKLADGRSTRHLVVGADVVRSEMTPAQASEYINRFGLKAWEALEQKRPAIFVRDPETMTRSQWMSLKRPEKVALNLTEKQISNIMGRR